MKAQNSPIFFHGIDATNYTRQEFLNPALVNKILTPTQQQEYAHLAAAEQPRYLAKHWAIREALFKAYHYTCSPSEIEITSDSWHHLVCFIDDIEFIISVTYCDAIVYVSVLGYRWPS